MKIAVLACLGILLAVSVQGGLVAHYDFGDGVPLDNRVPGGKALAKKGPVRLGDGTAVFTAASKPAGANYLVADSADLKTFTVSFWMKTAEVSQSGSYQGLFSSHTTGTETSWQFQSDATKGGRLAIRSGKGAGQVSTYVEGAHQADTWYNVVLSSADGSALTLTVSAEGGSVGDFATLSHRKAVELAEVVLGANRAKNQTYGMQLANVQVYDSVVATARLFAAGRAGAPVESAVPAVPLKPAKKMVRWSAPAGAGKGLPNIVVFLVDDMGLMDTSVPFVAGDDGEPVRHPLNDWYRTPSMERLAAQGIRFSSFYSHTVCSPSRVSIMTGQNSARHHTTNWIAPTKNNGGPNGPPKWGWTGLVNGQLTLPAMLKQSGYTAIHIGKAHFGPVGSEGAEPRNLGFDVNVGGTAAGQPGSYYGKKNYARGSFHDVPHLEKYHGSDTFLSEALTIEAKAEIDQVLATDQPFFLHMSHYAVHAPFHSDPRFAANYTAGKKKHAQAFATLIEGMDKSLGDLLDHLQAKGVAENTLIFFLGDNGSDAPLGSYHTIGSSAPLRGKKGSKWEGGIRVPFIAAWAKPNPANTWQQKMPIAAGRFRTDAVGACFDLFPTIAALVNAKVPADYPVDGQNLAKLLSGAEDPAHRNEFLSHFPHPRGGKNSYFSSYLKDGWKVRYEYFEDEARYALFNLDADLTESNDLAAEHPEKLQTMVAALVRELDAKGALYPVKAGEETKPRVP